MENKQKALGQDRKVVWVFSNPFPLNAILKSFDGHQMD